MELHSGLTMIGGLMSLGVYGCSMWGKRKQKDLKKKKLCALVLSKGTGKSRLKQKLEGFVSSNLTIVDVNDSVKVHSSSNSELEYIQKAKEYVKNLLVSFPKKQFLLLCSTVDEARELGVHDGLTFICTPTNELFNEILSNLSPSADKTIMEKARMSLISEADVSQLNIFSSFDELYSVIKTVYKLKNSF